MSATATQHVISEAATQKLWVVAESGDVDELARVFSCSPHVNARNKHGMTALMRAACQGHALMVRALLERGADPNLARNDKFTALALAAFFGHTETVKILIDHGANPNVITRCGASAQTWAMRRTFVEAARCLDLHAPALAPPPAPAPASAAPVAPLAVRVLKDPPEIWDLVREAPRTFDPRSAFVSRLTSIKTNFAFRMAAVMVVSAGCVVGVLVLRGSEARSLPAETPVQKSVAASEVSAPVNVEKSDTVVRPSEPEPTEFSHHGNDKPSRKVVLTRQTRSRELPDADRIQVVQSRETPAAAPVVAPPKIEPRNSSPKPNTSLSPQLISPAKSATPKAKVIQWP